MEKYFIRYITESHPYNMRETKSDIIILFKENLQSISMLLIYLSDYFNKDVVEVLSLNKLS